MLRNTIFTERREQNVLLIYVFEKLVANYSSWYVIWVYYRNIICLIYGWMICEYLGEFLSWS